MNDMMNVPEGWELKTLKDIASKIITGSTPSTGNPDFYGEDVLFVGPADLNGQKYIDSAQKKLTLLGFNQTRKLPKDTILVTCIGELGKIGISTLPLATNQQINSIICKKEYSSEFIYYSMLENIKRQMESVAGLQVVPIVNKTTFSKLLVASPVAEEEQYYIAKILSTLDQTIEATQKLIGKEKNIRKGLMHDLLTSGIDSQRKIRTPQTHKYKESELGMIPEEWEVKFLETITSLITDGAHFSPESIDDSKYKIVNVKDLTFNEITFESCASISKEDFETLCNTGCSPQNNDLLLSKDGTIGKVQVFTEEKKCVLLSSIAIIRLLNNFCTDFYKHYLRSFYFDKQLFALRSGSALSRIVLRDIKKLKMIVLDYQEQNRIAEILNTQDKKIETAENNLSKLKALKKGLMNDLLSGKVRVK